MDVLFSLAAFGASIEERLVIVDDEHDRAQCEENIRTQRQAQIASGGYKETVEIAEEGGNWTELLSILGRDGSKAWEHLELENKWKKQVVLAVFSSQKIPSQMTEAEWQTKPPVSIRNDREVLLARLSMEDFAKFYKYYSHKDSAAPFRIPGQFLGDEEVVAAAVRRYPEVLMNEDLPARNLFARKKVFLAFVQSQRMKEPYKFQWWHVSQHKKRLQLESLIGLFSVKIRSNASLMLKAAKHMKTVAVFQYCARNLSNNCSFAKKLAGLMDEVDADALKHFSSRVKADRYTVLYYVEKQGGCLAHADETLKGDLDVVQVACNQYAAAILCCTPETVSQFTDKALVMDILERWEWNSPKEPSLYGKLPGSLKFDSDILVKAHRTGNFSIADLPSELSSDRDFWLNVIAKCSTFFNFLPDDFENDPSFVRAIGDFESADLVETIFERFPLFAHDRTFWDTMLNSDGVTDEWYKDEEMLPNLIEEYAPEEIRSDKELMCLACGLSYEVLPLLSRAFQRDPEILRAAIDRSPFAFASVPSHIQIMYPDLAVHVIANLVEYDDEMDEATQGIFATELWSDFGFVKAWIEAGGFPHARIPAAMQRTHDFGLLVVENLGHSFYFDDLLAPELCNDEAFMTKAVKVDPFSILCASGRLRRDYDLSVLAYSRSSHMLEEEVPLRIAFLRTVVKRAQGQVQGFEGFNKAFVFGMTEFAGPDCRLPLLLGDQETSLALKQEIADFLGVPKTREELQMLRRVTENLDCLNCYCGMC